MPNENTPPGSGLSQLVGVWSIEPTAFESLYAHAMAVVESDARYEVVARDSKVLAEEQRDNPYQVDANGIAHFDVSGPLTRKPTSVQAITGGTSTVLLGQALRKAKADPNVKAALLHVDSPGGHSTTQADLRAEIRSFREAKPIAAHGAGSMCSAAYGFSAECDSVTADPAAVVGSVGTMMGLRDTSEVMKRAGVKPIYIATGDRKAALWPGQQISDETIGDMAKFVSAAGASFQEQVKERRPQISEAGMKDVLRGGVYAGADAKNIGLVDEVCDTETAIARLTQKLSSGSSSGSALLPAPMTGAPQNRSSTMLTPEQLTQAKSLPGCNDITAENADGKLLAAAISLASDNKRIATLESDLAAAQAKVPQQIPVQYLQQSAGAVRALYDTALKAQAFSPAVGGQLCSLLIGEGDNLNSAALAVGPTGKCLASAVFETLASNGAMPQVGKDVGAQPAPKAVAGAPDDKKPITKEREKELLAMSGVGTVTE